MKLFLVTTLAAICAAVLGYFFGPWQSEAAPAEPHDRAPLIAHLRAENARLKADIGKLGARSVDLAAPQPALVPKPAADTAGIAAARERSIQINLRRIAEARDLFIIETGRHPSSIDDLVGNGVEKYIRQLLRDGGVNYANVSLVPGQPMTVTTPDGKIVTLDETPNPKNVPFWVMPYGDEFAARLKVDPGPIVRAYFGYRKAHPDQQPKSPYDIAPYFQDPEKGAAFVTALQARRATPPLSSTAP